VTISPPVSVEVVTIVTFGVVRVFGVVAGGELVVGVVKGGGGVVLVGVVEVRVEVVVEGGRGVDEEVVDGVEVELLVTVRVVIAKHDRLVHRKNYVKEDIGDIHWVPVLAVDIAAKCGKRRWDSLLDWKD